MEASIEPINVLVVDDEAPARRRLVTLLAKDPEIGRISEAKDGVSAVAAIETERPDVVFLDVQMPGLDGFGVINAIGVAKMPLTVFVTGYDRFAVQAFESDATDYLLKPFGKSRYERTKERIKRRLGELRPVTSADANAFGPELLKLMSRRATPGELWQWILVKTGTSTRLIMTEDIDWVEAAGVYVTLHVEGEEFLYRASLATVASHLDPFQFTRIHRSTVVNLKCIASLKRRRHGEVDVTLKDGTRLMLSRGYREHFERVLGQPI